MRGENQVFIHPGFITGRTGMQGSHSSRMLVRKQASYLKDNTGSTSIHREGISLLSRVMENHILFRHGLFHPPEIDFLSFDPIHRVTGIRRLPDLQGIRDDEFELGQFERLAPSLRRLNHLFDRISLIDKITFSAL